MQRRAKKTAELRRRLCSVELSVSPVELEGEHYRTGEPEKYTLFNLDMRLGGALLTPDQSSRCLSVGALWLAQRYEGEFYLMTCSCGNAGCAGFHEPVVCGRKGKFLHWTFSDSYVEFFEECGFTTEDPQGFMVTVDAADFHRQFEAALNTVREYEKTAGVASGFGPGDYGAPTRTLDEQLARSLEWYMRYHGHERFARHVGKPAGVCAGA